MLVAACFNDAPWSFSVLWVSITKYIVVSKHSHWTQQEEWNQQNPEASGNSDIRLSTWHRLMQASRNAMSKKLMHTKTGQAWLCAAFEPKRESLTRGTMTALKLGHRSFLSILAALV